MASNIEIKHIPFFYSWAKIIFFEILMIISTIMDIIFEDFLILFHIFFSPQVKRSVIIGNKNGIYELPHESPSDLRLEIRKLGN